MPLSRQLKHERFERIKHELPFSVELSAQYLSAGSQICEVIHILLLLISSGQIAFTFGVGS